YGRQVRRWAADHGRLLERVRDGQQRRFAEPGADERHTQRQYAVDVPGRHGDVRVAGHRGRHGGADEPTAVVAAGEVGPPRRAVGGRDDRVQLVDLQRLVDGGPGGAGHGRALGEVRRVGQVAAGGLGLL